MKGALLLVALLTGIPAFAQTNTHTIEGRVLRAGTLEPIPNAQVRLTWPNPTAQTPEAIVFAESLASASAPLAVSMLREAYTQRLGSLASTITPSPVTATIADAEGRFTFKDAVVGQYRLRVQLDGYLPPADVEGYISSSGALKEFTVEGDKASTRVDVLLTKGARITGRVRDASGQPVPGLSVSAYRLRYLRGRPLWDSMTSQQTDDRGDYRLFWLPPGEYYVAAAPRLAPNAPTPAVNWERTFYPGVTDAAAVTPVLVRDGDEATGIDFAMRPVTAQTFTISGTAINPFARANPATGVVDRSISAFVLVPRQLTVLDPYTPTALQNAIPVLARPNGEFELRNVRAGSYDLYPQYQDNDLRRYVTSRTPVEVRNANVTGLKIALKAGFTLEGNVVLEGAASQTLKLDTLRLRLWPSDTTPGAFATIVGEIPVDAAGKFSAGNVPEAIYTFTVSGLPESAYVADVRQDGKSVYDNGFTLSSQSNSVQIVVNPAGATIEGTVMGAGRKPAARAYVTLAPPVSRGQNRDLYKTVLTDDAGHFTLKGVLPGRYALFSWDAIPWGAGLSAEFHAKYQERGRPVTITDRTPIQVQLDLISVPGLAAAPTGR